MTFAGKGNERAIRIFPRRSTATTSFLPSSKKREKEKREAKKERNNEKSREERLEHAPRRARFRERLARPRFTLAPKRRETKGTRYSRGRNFLLTERRGEPPSSLPFRK